MALAIGLIVGGLLLIALAMKRRDVAGLAPSAPLAPRAWAGPSRMNGTPTLRPPRLAVARVPDDLSGLPQPTYCGNCGPAGCLCDWNEAQA